MLPIHFVSFRLPCNENIRVSDFRFITANDKMVTATTTEVGSIADLKYFVYRTLCHDHDLLLNAFPTSEMVLKKSDDKCCGIMFCLHGPRAVKFSAIWEKENNRVLFYGPTGKRYSQVDLRDNEIAIEDN